MAIISKPSTRRSHARRATAATPSHTYESGPVRPGEAGSVTIIGAGAAGLALAFDLQQRGFDVLVYSHPDHMGHPNNVAAQGVLKAMGRLEGTAIVRMTSDMSEAVGFSNMLILSVPSSGHDTILHALRPFDLHAHTLIAIPGNLFGLIAAAQLPSVGHVLETNLSPYSSRMDGGTVLVLGLKERIQIASLHPATPKLRSDMAAVLPMVQLDWAHSVVEVSLSNVNGVFHPLLQLMNAGWIESSGGDFLLYAQGLSRSVANAMLAVDGVRLDIGRALGLKLRSAIEESNHAYGQAFTDLVVLGRESRPHNRLRAPKDMANRNVTEDVPDLLVCWHGLAERLGLDARPLAVVIGLAEMATGRDFMVGGRCMGRLGLEGVSRGELVRRFGHQKGADGRGMV